MRKATITRLWLGGIVAIALGLIAAGAAAGAILCSAGTFTTGPNGELSTFIARQDGYFWSWIAVAAFGGIVAAIGALAQFVAWIGAIANAYRLTDKMWFLLTLLLGLVGFGLVVMIVYLLLAPDSTEGAGGHAPRGAAAPPTFAPSH
jgi:hypothetical protein